MIRKQNSRGSIPVGSMVPITRCSKVGVFNGHTPIFWLGYKSFSSLVACGWHRSWRCYSSVGRFFWVYCDKGQKNIYQLFHEWASLDMRWYIANEVRSAKLAIINSYPTIVLLKTPTKYREFFQTLFVKTTDFQLVFNFQQTRTVTIFEEHGIMAHIQ